MQSVNEKDKSNFFSKDILIWDKKVPDTELEKFRKKIAEKYNITLENYWDLHKWSVEHFESFWEEIWIYFGMISSKPYEQVYRKTGDGFMDVEWFPGALFNSAEMFLRIRDDRVAIIYSDEFGNDETITFAEMYEEVKIYAAAFRKHGLKTGDVIACYMSNRKEAVFIYIAGLTIGAIFGGSQPFLGGRAASNIIKKLEPKFLFAIDHHQDNGIEYHNIENLPIIVNDTPSLEKVIIIPTHGETLTTDLSNIRNSCFLFEFLQYGIETDGTVPDIIYEQLPFNHPISINFTSGTTGLPKGPVHAAGTILSRFINIAFYMHLKPGDVLYSCYPVGWTVWNNLMHGLIWGVTLFLYAGCPYYERNGSNFWDILAEYKVGCTLMITSAVDKLEKLDARPAPESNLEHLKIIYIGGSPVKAENCLYIKNKVKSDVFVSSQYGATETSSPFTGIDFNLPSYAGECQIPGLGMDIRCFDNKGRSVINERGEMIVATPILSLPLYVWKDYDRRILKENYLAKYPGVWCQNDDIWINPRTKGIICMGRSDDTLIQNGERFGSADVYFAIHGMEEIEDYICVGQTRYDGETRAVLFVKMKEGFVFTPEFRQKVNDKIADELWADCVPQVILEAKDIPYNLNNKRMESVVRNILATNKIPEVNNIKNPTSLSNFCNISELVNFMKEQ